MGIKSNVFFVDLETIDQKVDDSIKKFAKEEELDVEDIVKIVKSEARKMGLRGRLKVTFKILDNSEDEFRIVVEPATIKYRGTTIIPFKTIKSDDFEISLDEVCGKVTLYNRKDALKKLSLTIDGIGLDLFVMTYEKAREYLISLSDRKVKNGYMDLADGVCFYEYGIKLNAQLDENGEIIKNAPFESVDVFSKYEFERSYEFSIESEDAKYDVQIPMEEPKKEEEFKLPEIKEYDPNNRYDYKIPEFSMEELNRKDEEERARLEQKVREEIEIIMPEAKVEEPEEEIQIDLGEEPKTETKVEEKVEVVEETPEVKEEVEDVKETKPVQENVPIIPLEEDIQEETKPQTLEEEIKEQANLEMELAKKFDLGLSAKLEKIQKEAKRKKQEKLENKLNAAKEVDNDTILLEDEEVPQVEEETITIPEAEEIVEEKTEAPVEEITPEVVEETIKEVIEQTDEKAEVVQEPVVETVEKEEVEHVVPEATISMQREIAELERLLLKEQEQQRSLEERIVAKLDELKKVQLEIAATNSKKEEIVEEVKEEVKETKEVEETPAVEEKTEEVVEETNEVIEEVVETPVEEVKVFDDENGIQEDVEVKEIVEETNNTVTAFDVEETLKEVMKANHLDVEQVAEPVVEIVKPTIEKKEEPVVEIPKKEVIEKVEYKEPENYVSYDIVVYEGIKRSTSSKVDVYIGQSKDEIRAYFKSAPKEVRDFDEMEIYDTFYAYYDDEDKCTGIGIYNQEVYKDKIALNLFGNNLITMKYKDIVALIKANDLGAIEDEDGIISLKLGISVDPKEHRNHDEMICDVIHIFKKGYYDEVYR